MDQIVVERHGRSWAVRHKGGFLGFTMSLDEAVLIAQDLVDWMGEHGGEAVVIVTEGRSFAPTDAVLRLRRPEGPS
jgi:hypothetical protein